ncbi:MAG: protein-glutamate O-methyltransferase CheR [Desulfovibrionales bacterium]|nr:protein-glutamate O-methyltransferase CheR [Desulfovibrionales bacterium]
MAVSSVKISPETQRLELLLLLEAIYQKYGYDFRQYSMAHIKRRIDHRLALSGLPSISHLQHAVLYDPVMLLNVLHDLSINVSEMFRDPGFFLALRQEVLPRLSTYPFFKIWVAGCAAGQEAYSTAILLHENGLYDRARIHATDFNPHSLEQARQGNYPLTTIKEYTINYQKSGGLNSFADYYTACDQHGTMRPFLQEQMVFAEHNLVTDGVFGEMQLILCRNVLIYFNKELQNRVVGLFKDSLCPGGFLCLGAKESLKFSVHADAFEVVQEKERIYRKKRITQA